MDTRALLDKCRSELERQKAIEAAATPGPWSGPMGGGIYGDGRKWLVEEISGLSPEDMAEVIQSRNRDRAVLEVAEEQLGYAQACWDDLMDTVGDDDPTAEQLAEMYDGTPHLNVAAKLLGVEAE